MALDRNKMAFISGPRQGGKTTLAKSLIKEYDEAIYKNWDESQFRKVWAKDPNSLKDQFKIAKDEYSRLLILDEIHKSKGWKQKIKGIYDDLSEFINIVVTGSARLNIFKKGGDSLMGRYLNFRLHPFSYGELSSKDYLSPEGWKSKLLSAKVSEGKQEIIQDLFDFSGFPEPYLAKSRKVLNIWRISRNEKIVREDLRDISRLPELSQVEMLASLLSDRVGNPLSIQSLREDLEVAHDTVKRWLIYLKELYYFFEIKPWSKSIPRSLKKEGKIYLYDWTSVDEKGFRFENLVACQLMKACHYWSDTGEGDFELFYLRNKEKEEIDFIIVKNKKPWLSIESKFSETSVNTKVVNKFIQHTKCPYIQVVFEPNIWRRESDHIIVMSANRLFSGLP
ncbi:MAG: ATP-binding protein [Pseudobdellovibrio sp.]